MLQWRIAAILFVINVAFDSYLYFFINSSNVQILSVPSFSVIQAALSVQSKNSFSSFS